MKKFINYKLLFLTIIILEILIHYLNYKNNFPFFIYYQFIINNTKKFNEHISLINNSSKKKKNIKNYVLFLDIFSRFLITILLLKLNFINPIYLYILYISEFFETLIYYLFINNIIIVNNNNFITFKILNTIKYILFFFVLFQFLFKL